MEENNIRIEKLDHIIIDKDMILKNIKEQYKIYIDNRLNCLLSMNQPITNNFLYIEIKIYENNHTDDILNYIEHVIKGYKKVYIPLNNKSNELCSHLLNHGYKCNKEYLYGVLFYKKLE